MECGLSCVILVTPRSTTPHDRQSDAITTATFGPNTASSRSGRAMRMQLELPVRSCSSPGLLALLIWSSLHPDTTPTESNRRFVPTRRPSKRFESPVTILRDRLLSSTNSMHTEADPCRAPPSLPARPRHKFNPLHSDKQSSDRTHLPHLADQQHLATRCSVAFSPHPSARLVMIIGPHPPIMHAEPERCANRRDAFLAQRAHGAKS